MKVDENLAFTPALELRELIRSKEVSPVEITELYLNRIDKLDSKLNSYLTVTREEALRSAKAAEEAVTRGESLGPLHGVPISIKDLEMTKGTRTTSGSLIYKDRVPDEDSVPVQRIKSAGAIVLGKTNTPEFGLLGHTENRLGDHCRNPWNTERTAGGSSGGAGAALAAGLCSLAQGSDGGGSIRIPSSFCGVYGIKPTLGRIPRPAGATPMVNHFSQHGPMTRTVRDSALLLQVLAGRDAGDPNALRDEPADYLAAADRAVTDLKLGWSPDYGGFPVDAEVRAIASKGARVFEELGCTLEEASLTLDEPFDTFWSLFCASVYATNGHLLDGQADQLTSYARESIELGAKVTGADYARALGQMGVIKARFLDQFERFDLLLTPTTAVSAFPVGQPPQDIGGREVDSFAGFNPFNYPVNLIGHPAANVPCGFTSEGLPVGLHIIGRFGDEATVLAASSAFEQARPWAQHRPPVS